MNNPGNQANHRYRDGQNENVNSSQVSLVLRDEDEVCIDVNVPDLGLEDMGNQVVVSEETSILKEIVNQIKAEEEASSKLPV